MAYEDITLTCADCGCEFEFTASEQEFYAERGLRNQPKRCKACRNARKFNSRGGGRPPRKMYDVICSNCGAETQVPFQPTGDRPVLCKACYTSQQQY